ncbi:MAG: aspartate--tRNA ligase [Desulfatibacillaceae bacterium]
MVDILGDMRRTHDCNTLSRADVGGRVVLMGWVQRRRDHGGVIFVDLRDREGMTQVVFNPEHDQAVHEKAHALRNEWVIAIEGEVFERPEGMTNPNMVTGEIEVLVSELRILNRAKTPPFMVEDSVEVSENNRLRYRYLDLRRPRMQKNLILRHGTSAATRAFLNENGFLEIETPFLTRSTPEGARDYLVPSRVNPGQFYALPQSPQLFKQLLMMAGYERYYQIARCFRDEDLRADRQPEFTQIDLEMSFVGEDDVMAVTEGLMSRIFSTVLGVHLSPPFERLTYAEAVGRFGLDKPDLRFGLELVDISEIVKKSDFKVFASVVKKGGLVKALNAKGCATFSRGEIDALTEFVAVYGAKGLAWIKVKDKGEWQSPITKFFSDEERAAMSGALDMEPGDLVFFVADQPKVVNDALGYLRNHLAEKLDLVPENEFRFVWVTRFPLMEWDEKERRYEALHHPFTSPLDEDAQYLESDPSRVRSRAYDLVLNGWEIGGGSIRIHRRDYQEKVFSALGMDRETYEGKFGFLMEALDYGAPPHGGIAFGLDRLVMILAGERSIRDVIPFPKTQKAACLMTAAPSDVGQAQLNELSLRIKKEPDL